MKPISAGAHVRVISPSWPALHHIPVRARRAEEVLQGLGLRVSYGAHAALITDDGGSAGSPQQRAEDFMEAFVDPSVDVVFSAFGGFSAYEVIPFLNASVLRGHRKPFIGNSDNAWLNQYLLQETGLSSFYGPTFIAEFGDHGGPFPETLECFRQALMSDGELVCHPMARRSSVFNNWSRPELERKPRTLNHEGGWHWVRPGRARGFFLGAELSCLIEMVEQFDLRLDGCVVFWDFGVHSTEEATDQLAELAKRTSLDHLAGMMVGPDARLTAPAWAGVVDDVLTKVVPDATYPVLVNADIGHLDPKWTVPYGREVVLDSTRGVVFPRSGRISASDPG